MDIARSSSSSSSSSDAVVCSSSSSSADTVCLFAWSWDEADQKMQRFRHRRGGIGSTRSTGAVSCQVLVQEGSLHAYAQQASGVLRSNTIRIFTRGHRLEHQTANSIFEGIRRGLPFDIKRFSDYANLVGGSDNLLAFWVTLGADRASANYVVSEIFFAFIMTFPRSLPLLTFCGAHGVALVRNKPHVGKELQTGLCSFTKWLRISRNIDALETALKHVVSELPFVWHKTRRPQAQVDIAEEIKQSFSRIRACSGLLTHMARSASRCCIVGLTACWHVCTLAAACQVLGIGASQSTLMVPELLQQPGVFVAVLRWRHEQNASMAFWTGSSGRSGRQLRLIGGRHSPQRNADSLLQRWVVR